MSKYKIIDLDDPEHRYTVIALTISNEPILLNRNQLVALLTQSDNQPIISTKDNRDLRALGKRASIYITKLDSGTATQQDRDKLITLLSTWSCPKERVKSQLPEYLDIILSKETNPSVISAIRSFISSHSDDLHNMRRNS
jgi:hypothetical protein